MNPAKFNFLIIGCCWFITVPLFGQGTTLLSTAGGSGTAGDFHLSYSIGEPFVQYVQQEDVFLTEGFQQPGHMPIMVSTNESDAETNLQLFPNPTTGEFFFSGTALDNCINVQIIDFLGRTVLLKQLTQQDNQFLSISHLNPGLYVVNLHCSTTRYFSLSILKI